ncbi:MAG: hypothetical protein E6J34_08620 [Chloroflexi bacterium]|nr:MAG: hypothetical protein E6J34_08620 [Chloroflexota bacterium]
MLDESLAGLLTVWTDRLQRKVEVIEKNVAAGNIDLLAKDLATCDTYLKKLFVRAKDYGLHTSAGPQLVLDLSRIKVRLEKLRTKLRYCKLQTGGEIVVQAGLWEQLA